MKRPNNCYEGMWRVRNDISGTVFIGSFPACLDYYEGDMRSIPIGRIVDENWRLEPCPTPKAHSLWSRNRYAPKGLGGAS